jgi:hypothetical protein
MPVGSRETCHVAHPLATPTSAREQNANVAADFFTCIKSVYLRTAATSPMD